VGIEFTDTLNALVAEEVIRTDVEAYLIRGRIPVEAQVPFYSSLVVEGKVKGFLSEGQED
jgi:hypothetical protein